MKADARKRNAGSNPVCGVEKRKKMPSWRRGNAPVSKTAAARKDAQVRFLQTALFADVSLIGKATVC